MPSQQSRKWCFTLNNPQPADYELLNLLGPTVTFLCWQHEIAPTTLTPHLQGFCLFPTNQRFNAVQVALPGCHLSIARGTSQQAAAYCKKRSDPPTETDYVEFGSLPNVPGATNRYEVFRDWILAHPSRPTPMEVSVAFPSIYLTSGRCMEYVNLIYPVVAHPLRSVFRPYQQHIFDILQVEPDSRKIHFVVDPVGNSGKSWFCRQMFMSFPDSVQILSSGKRDDVAYIIDVRKSIFLFDVPRLGLEYFQYSILEQLKNGIIQSNKYQGCVKILEHLSATCHIVVFSNEYHENLHTKVSPDRIGLHVWNYEVDY
nr:MAG: replication polyprotein [Chemarfal virus 263]